MVKAIRFGVAAALALAVSAPAWAGDDDAVSTQSEDVATDSGNMAVSNSSGSASEVGSGSGEPVSSDDANAYIHDRDLQEIWSANGGE